jgi:multidrug efflux system outer membrane protein
VEPAGRQALANLPWWELYRDPQLAELIRTALAQNLDLKIAVARVEEARARARAANADFFPGVNGTLSTSSQPGSVAVVPGATPGSADFLHVPSGSSFSGGASLSWELDFFGRVRRSSQAARADLLASEEGQRAVLVSLVGQVASTWFQLRNLDEQREITVRTIRSDEASLKLVQTQKKGGVASGTEVQQALGQLATVRAQLPLIEEQVAQAENQLSVLLGQSPGPIERSGSMEDPPMAPEIPAGLPSDLLERRPDIRQAEQQLIAATARIGVAKAETFPFPRILLTAFAGAVSSSLSQLLRGNGASLFSWGPGVNWPLLDLKGSANVGVAKAQAEQAALTYRSTILTALREVADALVTCEKVQQRLADEEVRVEAGREYFRLTSLRYRGGVADYLEVLDAERQLYSAEIDLSQAKLTKLQAVVKLYKALGGGWKQAPAVDPPG